MKQRLFFTGVVVLICMIVNLFVGLNDLITVIGLFLVALAMRPIVMDVQKGGRVFLANNFKDRETLHRILNNPGVFFKAMSFIAALVLAFGFFVVLKGVMLGHGAISSLIIIAIASLVLFPWLMPIDEESSDSRGEDEKNKGEESLAKKAYGELVDSAKRYAAIVARLVAVVLMLNVTLALILSGKDLSVFISTDISVDNFEVFAAESAIGYSGSNEYSRTMINAYILSDHLKLALGNVLFVTFLPQSEKSEFYYAFYFGAFLMNLVKLMPLSIGFVIFIGGVRRHSDWFQCLVERYYEKLAPKCSRLFGCLSVKLQTVKNDLVTWYEKRKATTGRQ